MMCEYSLEHVASRPAVVGDELQLTRANGGSSKGFFSTKEETPTTAVCMIPGTELAFAEPIKLNASDGWYWEGADTVTLEYSVAKFVEINPPSESRFSYHDGLEFPDGTQRLLQSLPVGQKCTVLQMPAQPTVSHINITGFEQAVKEIVADINEPAQAD